MASPTSPPLDMSVAVAMLVGVSLVQLSPRLPPLWVAGVVALLALSLFGRSGRWGPLVALAFGIAWACAFAQAAMQQRWSGAAAGMTWQIEGRVEGLPVSDRDSVRFDFRVAPGAAPGLHGGLLRLGWYGHPPALEPGSRWRLSVRLKRPHGVLNPGGYDLEKSALAGGIVAIGYVREPGRARQLSSASGVDAWREILSRRIAAALPDGRGRFIQALAIGDTRGLDDHDWQILRSTGLTHQIAISGFHVGMVAGFGSLLMLGLFRLWPGLGRHFPRPQAAALGAAMFAIGYTALAGFALPTVRTCLMIAAVLVGRLLRRAQSGAQGFALALVVVLLFDPLSVLAPGFWLSFLGVAWLLWCLPPESGAGTIRPFLEAQGVAVLGLLPLTVWFFGQASLPGPLANLVGIPVISLVVVPLALLGLLASCVSAGLSALLWKASAGVMALLWWLLERMAQWPGASVWLPEPSLPALLLACLGAFWVLLPRGVPGKLIAGALFLPLLWPRTGVPAQGEAEIAVIDVGQGLSVLVRTRQHALLFDAGPASPRGLDLGESAVVPALRALGVRHLDRMLISHGDNDHAGGADSVRTDFSEARVSAPEGWAAPDMSACRIGQAWRWDGVSFRILHPPPLFPYLRNDSSCVLRIEAGGVVALLPGDIGKHVESRLVREQAASLRADLLLVPHHGSETSSSPGFVAAVRPRWAVIGAGAENRFHLPRPDVVERYRRAGARVMNTADTGMLRFHLGEGGVALDEALRRDRPRYWRDRPAPAQAMLSAIPPIP